MKPSILADITARQYIDYDVVVNLETIAGGTPASDNVLVGWYESIINKHANTRDTIMQEISTRFPEEVKLLNEVKDDAEFFKQLKALVKLKAEEKYGVVFKRHLLNKDMPIIEGRQAKAMIKECANILFPGTKWGGSVKTDKKSGEDKVQNQRVTRNYIPEVIFVPEEQMIVWQNEEMTIPAVLFNSQRPVHIKQWTGETQTSIKQFEYAREVFVGFTIRILKSAHAELEPRLKEILAHAQEIGLGADRSQNFGRFSVIKLERRG